MSKSKSATKSVAVEPTPVTEEQPTPKGNVPPPPPPPPIGGMVLGHLSNLLPQLILYR